MNTEIALPKMALIDSGVNPRHFHVQGVEGGLGFCLDSEGAVTQHPDFNDEIGHGTAIAGIIRGKVPSARIYALKIFHRELHAPASLLLAALEWAISNNIKIIHLSLGTEREEYRADLEDLCRRAYHKGIVILAAARSPEDRVYPSVFETVTGVYWNRDCDENSVVYHPGKAVEFGAHGFPRAIPGIPQERNFCGNSFAVAYMTARAAQVLARHPDAGASRVKEELIKSASRVRGNTESLLKVFSHFVSHRDHREEKPTERTEVFK